MRQQSLNRERRVEAVLQGLKQILQKHGPPQHKTNLGVERPADVGVNRSRRGIDVRHAAKAHRRRRHRHHRGQQGHDRVSLRKNLRLAKHRHHRDRRGKNDAVVDQIPETQDPL